jgi:hypothetical protein
VRIAQHDGMIRFSDLSFGAAWEIPMEFLEHRDPTVDASGCNHSGPSSSRGPVFPQHDLSYSSDIPLGARVVLRGHHHGDPLCALTPCQGEKTDTAEMARKGQRVERELPECRAASGPVAVDSRERHHAMCSTPAISPAVREDRYSLVCTLSS